MKQPITRCGQSNNVIPLEFIQRPNDPNDVNEVDVDDLCEWISYHRCYGELETKGGTKVYKARTYYPETTAVASVAWSPKLDDVNDSFAVRLNNKVYHILSAVNVDEQNQSIDFYLKRSNEGPRG